jgi:hypothetical protein
MQVTMVIALRSLGEISQMKGMSESAFREFFQNLEKGGI